MEYGEVLDVQWSCVSVDTVTVLVSDSGKFKWRIKHKSIGFRLHGNDRKEQENYFCTKTCVLLSLFSRGLK